MFIYWEYSECISSYTKNTQKRIWTYTLNTRNARIVKYLGEFETKIENIVGLLSVAQMGSVGQITLNQNVSCHWWVKT